MDIIFSRAAAEELADALNRNLFPDGRNMLQASKDEGLPFWQDIILIFLQRNAYNPAEFFNIPSNQIVAIGAQVVV
jgi:KUP system potassium uptake protein